MATQQQPQDPDIPKRWPLIILPENRQEDTTLDARLVNAYMEKDARGDYVLVQRPGLSNYSQPSGSTGTGRGVYNWKSNVYSIVNGTLYKGTTSKGSVDTTNGVYRFSSCMGVTPKLQLGNGVKAYNYDDSAGLVQITDVDFPAAFVKGWAYLDQTTYVMDSEANIQGSGLDDPTSWAASNLTIAYIEPDDGVALAKQLVYVVAFKQWSSEIMYDAGSTPAPLGRVQGAKVNYGCASADSVRDLDGALFWLSTNRDAAVQVVKLENLKAEVVSSPAIDKLLSEADLTTVYSWTLKLGGHRWYAVTITASNITLVYDVSTSMWAQWTDEDGNYLPYVASTYVTVSGSPTTVLQHASNGRLCQFKASNTSDTGGLITVDIYTPNFDGGVSNRKALARMFFDTDQVTGSTLQVRCNDHDYAAGKWTNFRNVDLGQSRPFLDKCGSFLRRAYNFRHRGNTRFRIRAVDLQIALGTA